MKTYIDELRSKLEADVRIDPEINYGIPSIAVHLESTFPKTARKLYSIGYLVEAMDLENTQLEMQADTATRMLEAYESADPSKIFHAMSDDLRLAVCERETSHRMRQFMKNKHNEEYMANIISGANRLLPRGTYVTMKAIKECNASDYIFDITRMFTHARALEHAYISICVLDFNLPLYRRVVDAYEHLRNIGINVEALEFVNRFPIVDWVDDIPQIDFRSFEQENLISKLRSLDSELSEFMLNGLRTFLEGIYGHANVSGFGQFRTNPEGKALSKAVYAHIKEIEDVYSFIIGE